MNKTNNKRSKVDKCPSTFPQENIVKDISKNCILNDKMPEKIELKNGLVNGIISESNVKKSTRKDKKSKHTFSSSVNGESLSNEECESKCRPEDNYIGKTVPQTDILEDQSSTSLDKNSTPKSSRTVNNIDMQIKSSKKKKCKLGKLDSNDNISSTCDKLSMEASLAEETIDNGLSESMGLMKKIWDNAEPSCSNNSIPLIQTPEVSCNPVSNVLEVTDSLIKVQLEDSAEFSDTLENKPKIDFIQYESELQMPMIMKIIQKDLSEPYSIYTYRYFIHNWPKLCFLAMCNGECVGAIVCKLDLHRKVIKRGYIAMLAVDQKYRKLRIGSNLVQMAINEMLLGDADEVVLETEVTNKPALQLYEKLGFVRDKRLFRYYLNGVDALRLKLWLR